MPKIFYSKLTKKQLTSRTGDMLQFGGIRIAELADGRERGVRIADIRTGTGLNYTVVPDRAMDIAYAEYKGMPLCYISPTGITHPSYYNPAGLEWLYSYNVGLLNTCGLTYFGAPCTDNGQQLGIHGRLGNTPARNVAVKNEWVGDDYKFSITGIMVEAAIFNSNLWMTRKISGTLGTAKIFIEDTVENRADTKKEFMMLYHTNLGYPLLSEESKLIIPSVKITPRDAEGAKGLNTWQKMHTPVRGYKEQVFYHKLRTAKDGTVRVGIENKRLGIRFYIKYNTSQLPCFIQWKMLGEGTYVLGLEPGTNFVEGRAKERAEGRLRYLKPGEKRTINIEYGVEEI
ncbi:MAG: aldose 1-epimerase family protein [Elusimicrobiota bacterium]